MQTWNSLQDLSAHNASIAALQGPDPNAKLTPFEVEFEEVRSGKKTLDQMNPEFRGLYHKAIAAINTISQQESLRQAEAVSKATETRPFQNDPVDINALPPEERAKYRQQIADMAAGGGRPTKVTFTPAEKPKPTEEYQVPPQRMYELEAPPDPEPMPPKPEESIPEQAPAQLHHCGKCGWNQANPFPDYYSPADKDAYVQVILGGRKRFTKTYPLFGGRGSVTFRVLSPKEESMAYRQIAVDAIRDDADGRIKSTDDYAQSLTTYRALMSIERLTTLVSDTELDPVLEMQLPDESFKAPDTPLKPLSTYIIEDLFPTVDLMKAVYYAFSDFDRMTAALQTHAARPDF